MAEFSPMMQRYLETKEQYKDCILFYRLGDFYEMFFDDAIIAARELEITLTGKDCGQEERAPMAGVPHHAAEMYISRLIAKGYKVAICEQLEDPKTGGIHHVCRKQKCSAYRLRRRCCAEGTGLQREFNECGAEV